MRSNDFSIKLSHKLYKWTTWTDHRKKPKASAAALRLKSFGLCYRWGHHLVKLSQFPSKLSRVRPSLIGDLWENSAAEALIWRAKSIIPKYTSLLVYCCYENYMHVSIESSGVKFDSKESLSFHMENDILMIVFLHLTIIFRKSF